MSTLSAQLSQLKCSLHEDYSQSIAAVCLSENCQEPKRTLCSYCILYNHRGHQIVQLAQLGEMILVGLKEYHQNVLSYSATCIREMRDCLKLMTSKMIQFQTNFKEIQKGIKEEFSIEFIYKQIFINSMKKEQELGSIVIKLKKLFEDNLFKQPPNKHQEELFFLAKEMSLNTAFFQEPKHQIRNYNIPNNNIKLQIVVLKISKNFLSNQNVIFKLIIQPFIVNKKYNYNLQMLAFRLINQFVKYLNIKSLYSLKNVYNAIQEYF